MQEYFEDLMKPLVTNKKLEELLKSFQDEIVNRLEHKIKEQNTKIEELESKLAMNQTAIDNLEIKCDDSKQYSRRFCLRIHGLDFNSDEDNNVMEKVERCYRDMSKDFNQNEIDCAYYIGKSYIDKNRKKKVRPIIIKFKSLE